jgi:aminopeptidase N
MRKIILIILCLASSISFGFAQNWDWGGPIDPLQEKFKIEHYRLEIELLPETQSIKGKSTVTFSAPEKLDILRLDLIDQYTVSSVRMNGVEVDFSHQNDLLDIKVIDCTCDAVDIYYEGKTPIAINPPWQGGFTWEIDQLGNNWMGLSSQGEGAKIFMPALDHPSSEASNGVDLLVTVPNPYFVAANGRLDQIKKEGEKLTYHWTTDYPINNYGINFTMGIFHEEKMNFKSVSGVEIPMHVWVLQENKAKAKGILEVLEVSAQTHEKYFGAFPWADDKIAIVETPYLGMEHQTINAYGNNFQYVRMGNVNYDNLLHHELGHEWFGNKVSVGDWADFWIHEGITAFGDWMFFWEHGGEEAYFKNAKNTLRQISNSQPIVSPINSTEEEAYHSDIYTKGAFVMHSLRWVLGDDVFFPMLKAFASDARFTYENQVNTRDFIDFVKTYSGKDLEGFFQLYLYSTDLPKVKIAKKGKKGFEVSLEGINFQLPVEIETEKGIKTVMLGKEPLLINSESAPIVDPRGWLMLEK